MKDLSITNTYVWLLCILYCIQPQIGQGQNIVIEPYLQPATPTSAILMWEADGSSAGEVLYGLDPFTLDQTGLSTTQAGEGASIIHTATIIGLLPNTKYYYRARLGSGQETQLYTFKTTATPSSEKSTQLVAISDMQRDGSQPNKFREIIEDGIIPTFQNNYDSSILELEGILIPGDLVPTGGTYSQWEDFFFDEADSIFPYVRLYPVPGNHEYFGNGLPNFLKHFTLPQNGPVGLKEQCWYSDISNVRIIGLNSNSGTADQNTQLNWLGLVLDTTAMDSTIDFVFAQLHHPFKSELWTPGENSFTGKVIDSLEQFTTESNKASIHFFGHTHGYSRGQSRDHKHLWINVATAGGAIDNWGEFPNADYEEFVKSQDEYGFVFAEVKAGSEPQFTIKRYSRGDQDTIANNVLTDELTIFKNEWPPSQPVNIFPVNGDTVLTNCFTLKGSSFIGHNDSHQATHWQVAKGGDFVDSLVVDSWFQNENYYYDVDLQANDDLTDADIGLLPSNEIYHWRLRYRDQNLEWSPWSISTTLFLEQGVDTLSANLVVNTGAESGINGWTGDIESLNNGECNSVLPYQGNHNFAVGGVCANEMTVGFAYQSFNLSSYSTEIATGNGAVIFGGYMRNFNGSDQPEMYLEYYNNTTLISSTPMITNLTASWTQVESLAPIPLATNRCRMVLKGTRNAGGDNDSYFDELHLFVVMTDGCPNCFGQSGVDNDQDGYCDDLDCNDMDNTVYPGALEICDTKDNNCDGIIDLGTQVQWTGAGGNSLWSNPLNWDQMMVPLACQYVLIDAQASVEVDGAYTCKGLTVEVGNNLTIKSQSFLIVDSGQTNTVASIIVNGSMMIKGRCDVYDSSSTAFEVAGLLVNTNKLNTNHITTDDVMIKTGGRFESIGVTVFR